ncbi:ribosomal protein L5 [Tanacetum coccineum]
MFTLNFHYEDVSRQDPLLKPNHANVMEVPGSCKMRVVPKAAPFDFIIKNGKLAMEIPCGFLVEIREKFIQFLMEMEFCEFSLELEDHFEIYEHIRGFNVTIVTSANIQDETLPQWSSVFQKDEGESHLPVDLVNIRLGSITNRNKGLALQLVYKPRIFFPGNCRFDQALNYYLWLRSRKVWVGRIMLGKLDPLSLLPPIPLKVIWMKLALGLPPGRVLRFLSLKWDCS